MNLNLTAKTAVVTGASRVIALATVQTLIDEGARVVGAARTTVVLRLLHANGYSVDRHSYSAAWSTWRHLCRDAHPS